MNTLKNSCPETQEIITNARADLDTGAITAEQYRDIILSCCKAEYEGVIIPQHELPFADDVEVAENEDILEWLSDEVVYNNILDVDNVE